MLELLQVYARHHSLEAEPGFKTKNVRWAIVCDIDGRLLGVIELGDPTSKRNPGQAFLKCPDLSQPEMKAGGEIKSHFLVDTAEVIALVGKNIENPKVKAKHRYFIELIRKAGIAMPELIKLAELLIDSEILGTIRQRLEEHRVRPTDKVTFKLGEHYPVESGMWHEWWRDFRGTLIGQKSAERAKKGRTKHSSRMLCLMTGEAIKPAATHPKIEGLNDVGGLSTGDALISFKQDSFCSYGLVQSANAAVSEEGAAVYCAALNDIIKKSGQRLIGAKVVHWFKEKIIPEDDPLPWLIEGSEEEERNAQNRARELLASIKTGKRPDLANNYYYSMTLSGAAGRVMVRDWIEGQFEELVQNVHAWFDDLAIVRRDGQGLAPAPKFLALLGATVRELKDLPDPFITKMWHVAIRDEPIPAAALAKSLRRTVVDILQDQPSNHARMALLKAFHVRKVKKKEGELMMHDMKPYLNEDHPHSAYQCGRLMAVLAGLQHAALGDVGAGIVQRYYAAASVTPSLVFGRLVRTAQFHLSKLTPGLAHWYEDCIANIWGRLKDSVPRTLNLEEQSLFALGYYQQLAKMRSGRVENSKQEKERSDE